MLAPYIDDGLSQRTEHHITSGTPFEYPASMLDVVWSSGKPAIRFPASELSNCNGPRDEMVVSCDSNDALDSYGLKYRPRLAVVIQRL